MTDSATLKGDGFHIAQEISSRMKKELGITVSVGVSFNKIFAKLGSDYKKPDAITTMYEDEFQRKAWCLPVSDLLYVGNATNKKLYSMGIRTIGDLAKSDETLLVRKLGKMGSILWAFANGYDESPVKLENTSYGGLFRSSCRKYGRSVFLCSYHCCHCIYFRCSYELGRIDPLTEVLMFSRR